MNEMVTLHVRLLGEDVATVIRTKATVRGEGLYEILSSDDYEPAFDTWEFPPGTTVRCEKVEKGWMEPLFLAVEKVG